jgi:hypothetical protein
VAQNFLWSSGTSYCGIGAPIESLWYSYRSFASTKQLSVTTCTGLPEQDVEIDTRLSVFTIDEDDCSGIYTCLEWKDHIDQARESTPALSGMITSIRQVLIAFGQQASLGPHILAYTM